MADPAPIELEAPDEAEEQFVPPTREQLLAAGCSEQQADSLLSDVALGEELRAYLVKVAEERATDDPNQVSTSWTELFQQMNAIAERHGHEYGIPFPSMDSEGAVYPITAAGAPLRLQYALHPRMMTELEQELTRRNQAMVVRNSWERLGDRTVAVIETTNGPYAYWEHHAGRRLRKLMETVRARMNVQLDADAELRAMDLLKEKVNDSQWRCYVLNGIVAEYSPRSDLHYLFRKGYPALVLSYHGGSQQGRCIAALCLHPLGYYPGTHAGVMTPTDEVVAQLLMMRADEHKFWAKSGQWHVSDTRSGL